MHNRLVAFACGSLLATACRQQQPAQVTHNAPAYDTAHAEVFVLRDFVMSISDGECKDLYPQLRSSNTAAAMVSSGLARAGFNAIDTPSAEAFILTPTIVLTECATTRETHGKIIAVVAHRGHAVDTVTAQPEGNRVTLDEYIGAFAEALAASKPMAAEIAQHP